VTAYFKEYPDARFIDVGAGTGIFSYILCELGVPKGKIIALDRENPTHTMESQRSFWNIVTSCDILPTDVLFVARGMELNASSANMLMMEVSAQLFWANVRMVVHSRLTTLYQAAAIGTSS